MKQRSLREMAQAKKRIKRGDETPAAAWEVAGKASTPRKLDLGSFQRAQKDFWNKARLKRSGNRA